MCLKFLECTINILSFISKPKFEHIKLIIRLLVFVIQRLISEFISNDLVSFKNILLMTYEFAVSSTECVYPTKNM